MCVCVQATRRLVSGLRQEAAECRQLLATLAAMQAEAAGQAAARGVVAGQELARQLEQGARAPQPHDADRYRSVGVTLCDVAW